MNHSLVNSVVPPLPALPCHSTTQGREVITPTHGPSDLPISARPQFRPLTKLPGT